MTTSEEAFLSAMEREPDPVEAQKPVWREAEISVTRGLWRTHAMVHGVLEIVSRLAGRVRSMAERGPGDFVESEFERGVRVGARRATYVNGDSREPNGEKRLLTWILGVLGLLLVGGVGSVVAMYGKLSSIEKGQEGHEQRINRLEADRDQRYRGTGAASP